MTIRGEILQSIRHLSKRLNLVSNNGLGNHNNASTPKNFSVWTQLQSSFINNFRPLRLSGNYCLVIPIIICNKGITHHTSPMACWLISLSVSPNTISHLLYLSTISNSQTRLRLPNTCRSNLSQQNSLHPSSWLFVFFALRLWGRSPVISWRLGGAPWGTQVMHQRHSVHSTEVNKFYVFHARCEVHACWKKIDISIS